MATLVAVEASDVEPGRSSGQRYQKPDFSLAWGVMRHCSLVSALFAVGLIALALAAVRTASPALADVMLYGTYGILVVASVGAAVRGHRSGAWRGFVLVGWAYFLPVFVFGSPNLVMNLPTNTALAAYVSRVRPKPVPPRGFGVVEQENATISYTHRGEQPPDSFLDLVSQYNSGNQSSMKVGHLFITLVLALLGSILGHQMKGGRTWEGPPGSP